MIKRRYFIKAESSPTLINYRRESGLVTMCSGTTTHISWFANPLFVYRSACKLMENKEQGFLKKDIIITQFNRI